MKKALVILSLFCIASCSLFKKKSGPEKGVIARVDDDYLYASDVEPLTRGLKGNDSLQIVKNYAESWVRKKLLLQKAQQNIADDDPGITKKVEEYKETLLLYEYEKALINKRLDTAISQQELNDWYTKVKDGVPLEKDIYRLCFIKLKKDAPDIDNLRKVLKPKDDEEKRKLDGYCKEYATSYMVDSGVWYDKETVTKNFPLSDEELTALNYSRAYKEFKPEGGTWFIRVADAIKKDQPAPLDYIREKVVKAITEKRRLDLVERIYDKIYQDGIKSKSFEIFVK